MQTNKKNNKPNWIFLPCTQKKCLKLRYLLFWYCCDDLTIPLSLRNDWCTIQNRETAMLTQAGIIANSCLLLNDVSSLLIVVVVGRHHGNRSQQCGDGEQCDGVRQRARTPSMRDARTLDSGWTATSPSTNSATAPTAAWCSANASTPARKSPSRGKPTSA